MLPWKSDEEFKCKSITADRLDFAAHRAGYRRKNISRERLEELFWCLVLGMGRL
jgi:hypothetical protein